MIFNEGLVRFMEGLEVKEGSITVMVFTRRSCWVLEGTVGSWRVHGLHEGSLKVKLSS